jgi:heme exporter protein C
MKTFFAWLLWLWISLVIVGAFLYAPMLVGFRVPGSSRIVFFHVPMAWASFLGFIAAAVLSFRYLLGRLERWRAYAALGLSLLAIILAKLAIPPWPFGWPGAIVAGILSIAAIWVVVLWNLRHRRGARNPKDDRAAAVAIKLGLLFGVLATVTGAMWARIEWGAWWNWDPRQSSILAVILFYGAYLALRQSVEEPEQRARLAAAYALLGLVVTPFLYWVVPRITFSLHPDPIVNSSGKVDMEAASQQVLYASGLGFAGLFFWMHNLQCRLEALIERRAALKE